MKVLFKKLKKAKKIFLGLYLIVLLVYIPTYIFFFKNIINLTGIETAIRIILLVIFGIWILIYFIWSLINLILKKHITFVITTILSIIFIAAFCVFNHYISILYTGISNLGESKYVTYTTNLIALNGNTITKDSKLGMINSADDIEGNVLAKELIKNENLSDNDITYYASYYEMLYDLLNKKVDGIFINSNYKTMFSEEEFAGIKDTYTVHTFSKKMKNQDTTITNTKSLTEPFTILLMGVDSEANGLNANASFNGDTLMMITFNPKTLNATMFSIPRDTYVPIACNNNRYAKINSAAAYGTNCVISTVEELTDIDIDYYVKINFKGVVDLVEALGGIDVFVEAPDYDYYIKEYGGQLCEQNSLRQFGDNLICIQPGDQHLNGEEALAYARCRHGYLQSDIARNRHQQLVIEAIASKLANSDNIDKVEEILNAVTNNLATNMTKNQILSLYDVLKNMIFKSMKDGDTISIEKTYLEYYSLPVRLSNNGIYTSAIGYYPGSLKAITDSMNVNLGKKEKEPIKTFSFDANEAYTTKPTGQGITTGEKLTTVPNFSGQSVSNAESWASKNNITLNKEFVESPSIPGLIINQNVSNGILVNSISEITIYISEGPKEDNPTDNNTDNSENSNNKNNTTTPSTPDNKNNNSNTNKDPLDDIKPSNDNNKNNNDNSNKTDTNKKPSTNSDDDKTNNPTDVIMPSSGSSNLPNKDTSTNKTETKNSN